MKVTAGLALAYVVNAGLPIYKHQVARANASTRTYNFVGEDPVVIELSRCGLLWPDFCGNTPATFQCDLRHWLLQLVGSEFVVHKLRELKISILFQQELNIQKEWNHFRH